MTAESLADADARADRADGRKSARAAARAKQRQTPQDFKRTRQEPDPAEPTAALIKSVQATTAKNYSAALERSRLDPTTAASEIPDGEPFTVVTAPPISGGPSPIPDVRRRAQTFARTHPGAWIRYPSSPTDPYRRATSIAAHVRAGVSGFGPKGAFEYCTRDNVVYFRFLAQDNKP